MRQLKQFRIKRKNHKASRLKWWNKITFLKRGQEKTMTLDWIKKVTVMIVRKALETCPLTSARSKRKQCHWYRSLQVEMNKINVWVKSQLSDAIIDIHQSSQSLAKHLSQLLNQSRLAILRSIIQMIAMILLANQKVNKRRRTLWPSHYQDIKKLCLCRKYMLIQQWRCSRETSPYKLVRLQAFRNQILPKQWKLTWRSANSRVTK